MFNKSIYLYNLGRMKYKNAWELQNKYASEIWNDIKLKRQPKHKLLIVEHFPVYTIGIRDLNYSLEEENRLKKLGAEFYKTNRGGLITFHGPGQLIAYPILHLSSFQKGIKWYVCALEKTIIKTCQLYRINAHTTENIGIWVGDRKICAIGIQGRHVTTHGLALNCNNDLSWFDHIIPCGLEGKSVTSISNEVGENISINDVLPHFIKSFEEVFDTTISDPSLGTIS